jgi:crotonobetainyl-CoA:carnitine CoA-transferase CaiB-like acyl-CoA transferase
MELPLSGLVVADLSRVLAGPLAGMTLADLGADVIKVESPSGDDTRNWKPPVDSAGRSSYFHTANRNKRSIALDFKDEAELATVRELCLRSDVVLSNFRPGTLERYGLGYDDVSAENPGVIYCEISGFGGSASSLSGYDPLVQAVGGLMSITGPPGQPSKVGVAVIDVVAGLYSSISILAALAARGDGGRGQRIELNLLQSCLALLVNQSSGYLATGESPVSMGNSHPSIEPFSTFPTGSGDLMICAGNDRQFRKLTEMIGCGDLADDARFATNESRVGNREELRELLEDALAQKSAADWAEILTGKGVPAGEVNDLAGAFALASALGIDAVDEHDGVSTVRFPANFSDLSVATRRRPPELDEHGKEIREWLTR